MTQGSEGAALRVEVLSLLEENAALRVGAEAAVRRMYQCCFCHFPCDSLTALRAHSETCPSHPAVQRLAEVTAKHGVAQAAAERYWHIRDELAVGRTAGFADGEWHWRVPEIPGRHSTFDAAVDASRNGSVCGFVAAATKPPPGFTMQGSDE